MDTSLAACSVAIWRDGAVVAREFIAMPRGQAEALLPMVERVRGGAGYAWGDFDRLAVSIGPGSFAGIRVGLAAARGLALALDLPLAGIGTLELLAAGMTGSGPVAAVIDARNSQVYIQHFAPDLQALTQPALLLLDAAIGCCNAYDGLRGLRLVGGGAPLVARRLSISPAHIDALALPDAAVLAALAAKRHAVPGHDVAPLYLRPPDAKLPAYAKASAGKPAIVT